MPVGFLDHQPVSAAGGGEVGVDAAGAGGLVAVADETEKIFVIKCIIWIIGGKWKLISTNDQQFGSSHRQLLLFTKVIYYQGFRLSLILKSKLFHTLICLD